MPSPFPGMDPYLEPHWPDVHAVLTSEARTALNRQLPKGLVARVEERVAVGSAPDGAAGSTRVGPDVRVVATSPADRTSGAAAAALVRVDAPYLLLADDEPPVERYVRVIDADGELIAVVEFLSPANKRQDGRRRFRRNRRDLLAAGTHFVEVDLARAGNWRALLRPFQCPPAAVTPYRGVVRTAGSAAAYLFPISLRQPLPDLPVPLRPTDAQVSLPLQSLLNAAYDNGKYAETIDYGRPPVRPLPPDDAAWAAALLAGRPSH